MTAEVAAMLAEGLVFEMAFERKIAEQKARGREETINEHLAKLLAFDAPPELRASWMRELLRKHLSTLAGFRLKPDRRLISRRDWWAWLCADPFEGNEDGYAAVRTFHSALAERLSRGDPGADLLEAL